MAATDATIIFRAHSVTLKYVWLLAGPSQGHLVTSTQCLAVWCSLSAVASVVVGAKRTEKSYFKNKLDTGHSRGLLDMGGDTKMAQR